MSSNRITDPQARKTPVEAHCRMRRAPKKIDYREHETPDKEKFPNLSSVASATECTGLMYRVPANDDEREAYQELSSMEIPKEEPDSKSALRRRGRDPKSSEEPAEDKKEPAG